MALSDSGKLDITSIVGGAWDDIWRNWKPAVLLILVMMLGFVPLFAVGILTGPAPKQAPSGGLVIGMIAGFVLAIIVSSYAYILLMRLFMLGRSQFLQISAATMTLYFLRCLWKGIQLMVLVIPLVFIFFAPIFGLISYVVYARAAGTPVDAAHALILTLLAIAWAIAGIFVLTIIAVRLFPVFYSIVVGGHLRFRDAWRAMKGHTWRGFVCLFLVYLGNLAISTGVFIIIFIIFAVIGVAGSVISADSLSPASFPAWLPLLNLVIMLPVYYIGFTWNAATKTRIFKEIWPPESALVED